MVCLPVCPYLYVIREHSYVLPANDVRTYPPSTRSPITTPFLLTPTRSEELNSVTTNNLRRSEGRAMENESGAPVGSSACVACKRGKRRCDKSFPACSTSLRSVKMNASPELSVEHIPQSCRKCYYTEASTSESVAPSSSSHSAGHSVHQAPRSNSTLTSPV
jgi:hypothetical protein